MLVFFKTLSPITQALLATGFTWGVTALGASIVFVTREVGQRLLDALLGVAALLNGMLGFAAGVMIAASYWSLLAPSIELSAEMGLLVWGPPVVGFLSGGAFLWSVDKMLPHLHPGLPKERAEGPRNTWERSMLLILAITLHNFPEGLAIGVAFGAVAAGTPSASLAAALALALGIGLQNFPEGIAVALPLRREGMGRFRSFMFGQSSALVEPVAGVIGAAAVLVMRPILPYALAFAAGAMIYVVVEELVPEAKRNGSDVPTVGAMLGFALMMVLDVAFS